MMYLVGKKKKKYRRGWAISFLLCESSMITRPHATHVLTSHHAATAGLYRIFHSEAQGCICTWCRISILDHTNEATQST